MLNNPNEWHNIEENSGDRTTSVPGGQLANTGGGIKPLVALVLILVLVVLLGAVFMFVKHNNSSGVSDGQQEISLDSQSMTEDQPQEGDTAVIDINMDETTPDNAHVDNSGNPNYDSAQGQPGNEGLGGGNDLVVQQMPLNTKTIEKRRNDTVLVSVGGSGRENPFMPSVHIASALPSIGSSAYSSSGKIPFDIIEPPSGLYLDTKAEEMLQTTISGIMYDSKKPSAIINIQGQDQLVRKGDIISGYNILDITKDKVVIKQGTNIFRASVGQTLGLEGVNINEVYNLKRRFGGTYTTAVPNSIEIKAN